MKEIMKPGHPRWKEFRIKLQGKDGCNFSEDETEKLYTIVILAKIHQ